MSAIAELDAGCGQGTKMCHISITFCFFEMLVMSHSQDGM
jgi:hypothetical protein